MGKGEEEHISSESVNDAAQNSENAGNDCGRRCCFWKKFMSLRCVLVLIVSIGVFLSAVFWLPFFHSRDQSGLDLDSEFKGHAVVASFTVNKTTSVLQDNILRLQDDIFSIISFPSTEVNILSLDSSAGSNMTQVVFGVDSDETSQSLVRDAFVSLIINQSSFRLTESLFGDPSNFEVFKFVGGITVSPQQSAFLMQKVQILFNFTLNFSIQQLINNFQQLQGELKSGLRLSPYENLYISLINGKGSTVASPTIVKCRVLMAVGINPSMSRIKQLAQTISGSQKNLGLNHTVFGKVKQVSLSSILQHSLGSPSPSPSPSPTPHFNQQNHHRHHKVSNFAPTISPSSPRNGNKRLTSSPTPAPAPRNGDNRCSGCPCGYKNRNHGKRDQHSHFSPISPPVLSPKIAPSPNRHVDPRMHVPPRVPASSPLPHVILTHPRPPSEKEFNAKPPDLAPAISPSTSSSSPSETFSIFWGFMCCLFIVLQL